MRQKWIEMCGLTEFEEKYRLCSNHFDTDAYSLLQHGSRQKLKKEAYPTLNLPSVSNSQY